MVSMCTKSTFQLSPRDFMTWLRSWQSYALILQSNFTEIFPKYTILQHFKNFYIMYSWKMREIYTTFFKKIREQCWKKMFVLRTLINSEILIFKGPNVPQLELPVFLEPTVESQKTSYDGLFLPRTSKYMKSYHRLLQLGF